MQPHLSHHVFIQSQNRWLLTKEQNLHFQRVLAPSKSTGSLWGHQLPPAKMTHSCSFKHCSLDLPLEPISEPYEKIPLLSYHISFPRDWGNSHENLTSWHLHYMQESGSGQNPLASASDLAFINFWLLKKTYLSKAGDTLQSGGDSKCAADWYSLLSCRGSG